MGLEVIIGRGLYDLGSVVESEFEDVPDLISQLLRDKWKEKALETRSYLSGDYYQNIHADGNEVISDIGYGEIIESIGWPTQGPRFPAELAIEAADLDIEKILSDAAGRVLDIIEG